MISSFISVLIVFAASVSAQQLSSTLHITVTGVQVVYDGEIVNFTCVTRNSSIIAWSSDDYIGTQGTRLELIAAESLGTTKIASTGLANATLISVNESTPERILVSMLRIRITSRYQSSSVTCHSVGTGGSDTIKFYMAGMPALCNYSVLHVL